MSLGALLLLLFSSNLITFGSGRVMVPLLQHALVDDSHALTLDQFLFAFTIGRITPGPANLYVAAIGYMVAGWVGAFLTVIVVLLPAYLVVPLHLGYQKLEGSGAMRGFGRGITASSVGLILVSTIDIGRGALTSPTAVIVCVLTLVLLHVLRWNPLLCLAAAAAAGVGLMRVLPA